MKKLVIAILVIVGLLGTCMAGSLLYALTAINSRTYSIRCVEFVGNLARTRHGPVPSFVCINIGSPSCAIDRSLAIELMVKEGVVVALNDVEVGWLVEHAEREYSVRPSASGGSSSTARELSIGGSHFTIVEDKLREVTLIGFEDDIDYPKIKTALSEKWYSLPLGQKAAEALVGSGGRIFDHHRN